jgi:hypothetical protein
MWSRGKIYESDPPEQIQLFGKTVAVDRQGRESDPGGAHGVINILMFCLDWLVRVPGFRREGADQQRYHYARVMASPCYVVSYVIGLVVFLRWLECDIGPTTNFIKGLVCSPKTKWDDDNTMLLMSYAYGLLLFIMLSGLYGLGCYGGCVNCVYDLCTSEGDALGQCQNVCSFTGPESHSDYDTKAVDAPMDASPTSQGMRREDRHLYEETKGTNGAQWDEGGHPMNYEAMLIGKRPECTTDSEPLLPEFDQYTGQPRNESARRIRCAENYTTSSQQNEEASMRPGGFDEKNKEPNLGLLPVPARAASPSKTTPSPTRVVVLLLLLGVVVLGGVLVGVVVAESGGSHSQPVTPAGPPTPTPMPPTPTPMPPLAPAELAAWQDLYDSTNGPKWSHCSDSRSDPCSCSGWGSVGGVTCTGGHITEM